jgi:branched-chain amino acid transport system substrate-binding protein
MKKRNLWVIIGAVVVIAAVIVGIQLTQKPAPKGQVIKIGAILPLTGPSGVLGNSVIAGMKLAFEDFNKVNSTRYVLDVQDTQGDPRQAVDIYQRNKALYPAPMVLSWMSNAASALVELTETDKIVLFMGAAKASLSEEKRYAIRVFPNAVNLAEMAATFVQEALKARNVGIFYINDDYGKDVSEKFTFIIDKAGIRLIFSEPVDAKAQNYRDYVVKHKAKEVDLIYVVVYGTAYPPLLKEIKQYFPSTRIFADITFCNYNTQQEIGNLGDGIYTIGTEADDKTTSWEPAKRFQSKIKDAFNLEADFNSALGYDMAWIALESLHLSKSRQSDEIVRYIVNKREFDGVSGKIIFEKSGNAEFTLKLLVREGGPLKRPQSSIQLGGY